MNPSSPNPNRGLEPASDRRPGSLSKPLLATLCIALTAALYVFSAAPMLQLATSRSTASTTTPPAWKAIYRPVTWLMKTSLLRKPLFQWSDRWVSRESMEAAVDEWVTVGGSGTTTSFSVTISCTFDADTEEDEALEDAATAEIPEPRTSESAPLDPSANNPAGVEP